MKTPDEIKEGLYCCYIHSDERNCGECPYIIDDVNDCDCSPGKDAYDYIQHLEHHIGELTEKVAQLEAIQPKWISVEERLPDAGEKVIVCGAKNGMQVGAFRGLLNPGNIRKWWLWKKNTILEVTHWMPIPQMPKEDA